MYQLAAFKDKTFTVIKDITENQYIDINNLSITINLFFKDIERLNIAFDALNIYQKTIRDYIDMKITYHQLSNKIPKHVHDYLAAFRSFIDHWETYLSRKYGNESDELKQFKSARSQEFDQFFSYRFIYELRNFTLHCDMPLSTLSGKLDENEKRSISLIVNRDRLLTSFKWPKKVGLEQMPAEFELNDHIVQSMECLKRIQDKALNIGNIDKVYTSAKKIVALKKEYPTKSNFGVIKHDGTSKETYIPRSIELLPIEKAEIILKMIQ